MGPLDSHEIGKIFFSQALDELSQRLRSGLCEVQNVPTRRAGRLGGSKSLGWLDVYIGIILPMLYGDYNDPKRSFNCSGAIKQCKCMVSFQGFPL